MDQLNDWAQRNRVLVAFIAGAVLTLLVALVITLDAAGDDEESDETQPEHREQAARDIVVPGDQADELEEAADGE